MTGTNDGGKKIEGWTHNVWYTQQVGNGLADTHKLHQLAR